jgi:hypothetical protein
MKCGMDVLPQVVPLNTYFSTLHSVIPTIRILEVVRCSDDDDATTHDTLRMRNINPTSPNLTQPNATQPLYKRYPSVRIS